MQSDNASGNNTNLKRSKMSKRIIQSGLDIYQFSNSINGDVGMLIEKNGKELGVYTHFEYGENLDGDYLMELALEFEQDND